MRKKIDVYERVASFPQPTFNSLTADLFIKMFEEDRAKALESEDAATIFLEQSTDVEALVAMSEVSLQAPLNDIGYRLMMHLANKVFSRAGIQHIPDFIEGAGTLEPYYQDKLNRFKRDIRAKQGKLTQKEQRYVSL